MTVVPVTPVKWLMVALRACWDRQTQFPPCTRILLDDEPTCRPRSPDLCKQIHFKNV